jgi:putative radical SAM enzyme (TIGR03279 family)
LKGKQVKKQQPPRGEVIAVEHDSPAAEIGFRPGDRIIDINGLPVRDVLDLQFHSADDELIVAIERQGELMHLQGGAGDTAGVRFKDPAFDGIRWCNNKCPFCFVKQLPPKMRSTLYIKDDDYRYSAMYGNFVTLSNMTEDDWTRIEEQHLGPYFYVSVHATDRQLRGRLLGNPNPPDVLEQLRRLGRLGVRSHTQAVLCPGINDGPDLDQTIGDLVAMYPTIQTLAIVPVGLTNVGRTPSYLRRHTPEEAVSIVRRTEQYRRRFRRELGVSFLHASDEFYLLAGLPVPGASTYDGYPQYQNGVGMVRSLLEEWSHLKRRRANWHREKSITAVCGTLAAPILAPMLAEISSATGNGVDLVTITNEFFGPIVNVSGLLVGRDIVAALKDRPLGDLVALPRAALDIPGDRFLDNLTPVEVARAIGRPIVFVENLKDLLAAMGGRMENVIECAA